jgi:hypothetical protein
MTPANMSTTAFLVLLVWRFVSAALHRRSWVRAIALQQQQQQHSNLLEESLHISAPRGVAGIAGNRFESSSEGPEPLDRRARAKSYLRRIVALTGAVQKGYGYVLDVGTIRFHVRDRFVRRLPGLTGSECAYEETCFYPLHKGMPKEEEIAAALLQLANNPALFDKWAVQDGLPFKADGQVFTPPQ